MRTFILTVASSVLLASCALPVEPTRNLAQGETGWITYPSSVERLTLRGHLRLPASSAKRVPAMIIAHASGGLDPRNRRWASFFQEQGFATFEMDYFGPRQIVSNSRWQPTPVHDAYDALKLLATHPNIDPSRIGIIGFSRGANIALGSASAPPALTDGHRFAAHVALYPTCRGYSLKSTGEPGPPVLVLLGTKDDLTPPQACEDIVAEARAFGRDASSILYEGAYHAWDGDYAGTWFHPAAGRSYSMFPNQEITNRSRNDVLTFLQRVMNLSPVK